MTERTYRIILGIGLLVILYVSAVYASNDLIYAFIVLLCFEGITNWRIPRVVSGLKEHFITLTPAVSQPIDVSHAGTPIVDFEAERALRLIIAFLLSLPLLWPAELLWIRPWFIACMLLLAGVTNICPMLMLLRRLGLK